MNAKAIFTAFIASLYGDAKRIMAFAGYFFSNGFSTRFPVVPAGAPAGGSGMPSAPIFGLPPGRPLPILPGIGGPSCIPIPGGIPGLPIIPGGIPGLPPIIPGGIPGLPPIIPGGIGGITRAPLISPGAEPMTRPIGITPGGILLISPDL